MEGTQIDGVWDDGKLKDGKGLKKFKDGRIYDGELKDGLICGNGTMVWANGDYYIGIWENEKR